MPGCTSGVANYFLTQHDPWEKKSKTDLPAYVIKKRFPNTSGGNVFSFNVTDTPCTATITATSAVAAAATVTLTSSFKLGDIVTLGGSVATTVTMTITIGMASTTTLPPHSRAWPEGHFIYHDEEWITPHYISAGKDSEPTQRFTHSIDSGLGWSDCEPYDP